MASFRERVRPRFKDSRRKSPSQIVVGVVRVGFRKDIFTGTTMFVSAEVGFTSDG